MVTNRKQCRATRKDGRPCTAPTMGDSDYCFAHDPTRRQERDDARRKGGRNRARTARAERLVPATLRPVLVALTAALREVHDGVLAPAQANAMASVAGSIVRTYQIGEVEERLAALEAIHDGDKVSRGA